MNAGLQRTGRAAGLVLGRWKRQRAGRIGPVSAGSARAAGEARPVQDGGQGGGTDGDAAGAGEQGDHGHAHHDVDDCGGDATPRSGPGRNPAGRPTDW